MSIYHFKCCTFTECLKVHSCQGHCSLEGKAKVNQPFFLVNFKTFRLIYAVPFGREAQHSQVSKKQEKTKNKNLKQTGLQLAFRTTLSGVKQRKILAFEVSVQKKTLILLENQLLYLCKVSRIFFGTYKKKVYKLKMVTTTARI